MLKHDSLPLGWGAVYIRAQNGGFRVGVAQSEDAQFVSDRDLDGPRADQMRLNSHFWFICIRRYQCSVFHEPTAKAQSFWMNEKDSEEILFDATLYRGRSYGKPNTPKQGRNCVVLQSLWLNTPGKTCLLAPPNGQRKHHTILAPPITHPIGQCEARKAMMSMPL